MFESLIAVLLVGLAGIARLVVPVLKLLTPYVVYLVLLFLESLVLGLGESLSLCVGCIFEVSRWKTRVNVRKFLLSGIKVH